MNRMDKVVTDAQEMGKQFPILKTGFSDIDDVTGYLRKGTVSLLGARPGMGRSTLAAQFVANIADEGGQAVWFSTVRSEGEVAAKIVNAKPDFRSPQNIFLEDRVGNERDLRIAVENMEIMPDLVIVDQLQKMYCVSKKGSAVYDQVPVCASLKTFARQCNVAVLLLSQITLAPEYRSNYAPRPTDIPQWEGIKQNIDSVCLFYRDGYYDDSAPDIHNATFTIRPSKDRCANLSLLWDRKKICFLPFDEELI